jgi:hypothetical protein
MNRILFYIFVGNRVEQARVLKLPRTGEDGLTRTKNFGEESSDGRKNIWLSFYYHFFD